ncbi:uncharacterized protein EV422DRAFT_402682 [Fimicolochytrium jonesii]|uniref:uncharacterized protein n=1 Tax=Fimicolochytrium jonesii TaxID=1396493 RepID=UPI0022FE77F3|nr:uncharacterized protein EV422DRAFT_402682 [Fimicolochytrium jonesii]KAI8822534.1 hypothetical protein EV422DRAFT_402682 [Fimicolochytrium jonesii]
MYQNGAESDPANAASYDQAYYGGAAGDWSGYQYSSVEAPPGVDPQNHGLEDAPPGMGSDWLMHAQQAEVTPVTSDAPGAAELQQDPSGNVPEVNNGTSAPESDAVQAQGDQSQYQGYDYTAYAGAYGYYDPNAAYYGNAAGYNQYASSQAYGQNFYTDAYAAALAAPKEIHNPFENLGKETEAKPDVKKVTSIRRGGPPKKKIILAAPAKKVTSAVSPVVQQNSNLVGGPVDVATTDVAPVVPPSSHTNEPTKLNTQPAVASVNGNKSPDKGIPSQKPHAEASNGRKEVSPGWLGYRCIISDQNGASAM